MARALPTHRCRVADLSSVTVILDRRVNPGTHVNERRVVTIDEDLEALGWAIVPLGAG